jgi:hypothetical protein
LKGSFQDSGFPRFSPGSHRSRKRYRTEADDWLPFVPIPRAEHLAVDPRAAKRKAPGVRQLGPRPPKLCHYLVLELREGFRKGCVQVRREVVNAIQLPVRGEDDSPKSDALMHEDDLRLGMDPRGDDCEARRHDLIENGRYVPCRLTEIVPQASAPGL